MGTQNRYRLSDSEMLYIFGQIDNSNAAVDVIYFAVTSTWNAIFAQEGKSFSEVLGELNSGKFDPTAYAIPEDQSTEIMERMKTRLLALNISEIGVANALLDFVNVGPSTYNDEPKGNSTDHILPPPFRPVFTVEDAEYGKRLAEQDGYYDK